jgi:hypothetical protein
MSEEIKQLITETVHQELLNETKALRYTKRVRNHYLTTQQPPLVEKIEKTVEEKLHSLKVELDALKASGLKALPHRRKEFDDDEESAAARGKEFDVKIITDEVNRSVENALKRFLGDASTNQYRSSREAAEDLVTKSKIKADKLPVVTDASLRTLAVGSTGAVDNSASSHHGEDETDDYFPQKLDTTEPVDDKAHRNNASLGLGKKPHVPSSSGNSKSSSSDIDAITSVSSVNNPAVAAEEENYRSLMSKLLHLADVKVRMILLVVLC